MVYHGISHLFYFLGINTRHAIETTQANTINATYARSMMGRLDVIPSNRPFARSGHMVRNKLCLDASYTVGLSKQKNVGLNWYKFLCFKSPTVSLASQHNLFRTM